MIEAGLFVAIGLLLTLGKLSWRGRMWVISHPLLVDLGIFILLVCIHWGTYSGVMAATVGALICSAMLSIARKLVGHCVGRTYFPGLFNISDKLIS